MNKREKYIERWWMEWKNKKEEEEEEEEEESGKLRRWCRARLIMISLVLSLWC